MTRVALRIYHDPGEADVFMNIRARDDGIETLAPVIDTGAETTTLPKDLLDRIIYRLSPRASVTATQAGIATQTVEMIEAYIVVSLEDAFGNRTKDFEILCWFTDTEQPLLGFTDVLDRAILHLDMVNQPAGYIEIPD
jgi:predicted aspartyl protease